jgi:ATP-dependent DNA helicase RecG
MGAGITLADLAAIPIEDVVARVKDRQAPRASALKELGIENALDLLTFYPRRYLDRRLEKSIANVAIGEDVTITGTIRSVLPARRVRSGRSLVEVELEDDTGYVMWLVFFNQPWRDKQLKRGQEVAVFGRVGTYKKRKSMTNPVVDVLGSRREPQTGRIVPLYPASEKSSVSTYQVAHLVRVLLDATDRILDPINPKVRERLGLESRDAAFRKIHRPEDERDYERARRRLAFDELVRIQLPLHQRRLAWEASPGFAHPDPRKDMGSLFYKLLSSLHFQLTEAQSRALDEILSDMARPFPMHRLLQGDVGSGKTVVALLAATAAIEACGQVAFMVPTEVLAEQHFASLSRYARGIYVERSEGLFSSRPLRVELLTSSVPEARRKRVLADLASGLVDIVVGTHSLISEGVEFGRLTFVIIDEQHRFGVEQRAALAKKAGGVVPDVLIMTATPIPRTAALVVYGDLQQSVIDQLPPGRRPVETRWFRGEDKAVKAWEILRREVESGHKAYVVCPAIEDADTSASRSIYEVKRVLERRDLKGIALGVLHGKMKPAEKDRAMADFVAGRTPVLVATTVIEVGIDVPDATVMVVVDADRFGISQLHQLRGRVGRSDLAAYCLLVTKEDVTEDAEERLAALCSTTNGFELAEVDMRIRGTGTLMGTLQRGRSDLRLTDLRRDRDLVEAAREFVTRVVQLDPDLQLPRFALLKQEVESVLGPEKAGYLFKY